MTHEDTGTQGAHRGTPAHGRFRATHTAVRDCAEWPLAGIHLSPITAPPEARPSR
jgi:hypothetical protein